MKRTAYVKMSPLELVDYCIKYSDKDEIIFYITKEDIHEKIVQITKKIAVRRVFILGKEILIADIEGGGRATVCGYINYNEDFTKYIGTPDAEIAQNICEVMQWDFTINRAFITVEVPVDMLEIRYEDYLEIYHGIERNKYV